jgi:hypothetical protein
MVTGPAVPGVSLQAAKSAADSAKTKTVVTLSPTVSTSTPCQVQSFKTSSKTGIGESGLSSVTADYQVKPCDSKHTVTLDVLAYETWDPANVMLDIPNAPLSDDVSIIGVKLGVSYTFKLIVRDGVTGDVVATASRTASAPFPTGV